MRRRAYYLLQLKPWAPCARPGDSHSLFSSSSAMNLQRQLGRVPCECRGPMERVLPLVSNSPRWSLFLVNLAERYILVSPTCAQEPQLSLCYFCKVLVLCSRTPWEADGNDAKLNPSYFCEICVAYVIFLSGRDWHIQSKLLSTEPKQRRYGKSGQERSRAVSNPLRRIHVEPQHLDG